MQTTEAQVFKARQDVVCVSVGEREAAAGSSPQQSCHYNTFNDETHL